MDLKRDSKWPAYALPLLCYFYELACLFYWIIIIHQNAVDLIDHIINRLNLIDLWSPIEVLIMKEICLIIQQISSCLLLIVAPQNGELTTPSWRSPKTPFFTSLTTLRSRHFFGKLSLVVFTFIQLYYNSWGPRSVFAHSPPAGQTRCWFRIYGDRLNYSQVPAITSSSILLKWWNEEPLFLDHHRRAAEKC